MPIVDIFEFIAYTLRNGEKRQNSKLRLEKVRVMSAKVVGLSIIALTGAVAIWIACQLQIQWLGIVGLFVVALADAVLFGEGLSNHKNYEDIPIHVMTILLMVMIVVALLKFLDPVVIVPIVPYSIGDGVVWHCWHHQLVSGRTIIQGG